METDERVAEGFFLALDILDSLGVAYDHQAVVSRLVEVASGEISLVEPPHDDIAGNEGLSDTYLTPAEYVALLTAVSRYGSMNSENRLAALRIARVIARDNRA